MMVSFTLESRANGVETMKAAVPESQEQETTMAIVSESNVEQAGMATMPEPIKEDSTMTEANPELIWTDAV